MTKSFKLRDLEHVTSILVTHQIRDGLLRRASTKPRVRTDAWRSSTPARARRFLVLHEGRISFEGTGKDLLASQDAYLKEFLFLTLPPW